MAGAVGEWAVRHPHPDRPILMTGSVRLSPRQLAKELVDKTEIGLMQIEAFRRLLNTHPNMSPDHLIELINLAGTSTPIKE